MMSASTIPSAVPLSSWEISISALLPLLRRIYEVQYGCLVLCKPTRKDGGTQWRRLCLSESQKPRCCGTCSLPPQHGHRVEVPIADVGAILVGPLCGAGLGWGAWLWRPLRLPTRGRWLRGSGGPVVWPARPPGGHSGKRLGGLWLAIRGACRGVGGGSEEGSPRTQPGCQLLLLRTLVA